MDLFVAGRDQSAADQSNNLAEPPIVTIVTIREGTEEVSKLSV